MDTLILYRSKPGITVRVPMTLDVTILGKVVDQIDAFALVERSPDGWAEAYDVGVYDLDNGHEVIVTQSMSDEIGRIYARRLEAMTQGRDMLDRFEAALVEAERQS